MDLLSSAYAAASDDEEPAVPPPKRTRTEYHPPPPPPAYYPAPPPPPLQQSPRPPLRPFEPPPSIAEAAPSRYISKRERAILAASSASLPPDSPVGGTISDLDMPCGVLPSLRCQTNVHAQSNKVHGRPSVVLDGHRKAVNSIQWSDSHGHLLASAGMDLTVCVWNVWNRQPRARVFKHHNAAVKDVRWSQHGLSLLSCGYDCSSRLVDVEKGTETQVFKEDQVVEAIRFHPRDPNLFLSGGVKGFLRLWDIRAGKVAQEYHRGLGPIFDIEFRADGKHFISSSDTSRSNITENSIVVWDVSRQVPLSNQVYLEAYNIPCIRYHPSDACFVAQTNGNYIAIFSSRPPFKLDRHKRYAKHGVWGFPVKCNFSLDGKELASGSSDGCIYFYNYQSSELLRKFKAFEQPCIDVAFHPFKSNVVASCSWTGDISVFE